MMSPRGDDRRGEHFDRVVVIRDGSVVGTANGLQLVLHLFDLSLQVEELRVSLQFGIVFDSDVQPAEQRGDFTTFANLLTLRCRCGSRAQVGDTRQNFVLVAHVGLDRCNEIRNQVVALLQYHADAAPALFDTVTFGDEVIVGYKAPYDKQYGDNCRADYQDHSGRCHTYIVFQVRCFGLFRCFRVSTASSILHPP